MKKTSKFIIPSSVLLLGSAATLFADYDCPRPEPKPECPSRCAQLNRPRGPMREITPNAGPCVNNGADVFITADFIYWTAREDGLNYMLTTGTGATPRKGSYKHPDFKFKPGFKVGLGLNFEHDGWDLYAQYTWLRGTFKDSHTVGTLTGLDFEWTINNAGTYTITSGSGKWRLRFNVVDLDLGRNYYISRYLMLRPFFGLKGAWGSQKFNVNLAGTLNAVSTARTMRIKEDFWGVGIHTGLNTAWHFTKSFSMYGNFAIAELWEGFEVDRKDNDRDLVALTNNSNLNTQDTFHTIKPVIEMGLGLRWETWFYDDNYHFQVDAGWEEQFWGEQNQFVRQHGESNHGDLALQGFTLHFRFDF